MIFTGLQPSVDRLRSTVYGVQPEFEVVLACSNKAKKQFEEAGQSGSGKEDEK